MPTRLKIRFKCNEGKSYSYSMASLAHGYIMEIIEPQYASLLHNLRLNPYSQYIARDKDDIVWVINTLDTRAKKEIIDKLIYNINNEAKKSIFLKKRNETLYIKEFSIIESDYKELNKILYENKSKKILKLKFITPTSFRQDNRYCIFPSVRLIFQSLMHKYDAVSVQSRVYDAQVLKSYEEQAYIEEYKLRSTVFSLEGIFIPAFIGEISIKINAPTQLVNLAYMLAEFGCYAGVGIKTAVGMGAIAVIK